MKAGPVIGAVLGVAPMWLLGGGGVDTLRGPRHHGRHVIAVLLSERDEMIPIFLAAREVPFSTMGAILGAKVVVGIVAGLALDGVLRLLHRPEEHLRIHELCQRDATATANVTPAARIPSLPTRRKRTRNTITIMRALPS